LEGLIWMQAHAESAIASAKSASVGATQAWMKVKQAAGVARFSDTGASQGSDRGLFQREMAERDESGPPRADKSMR
jgi:hypothetical protein